MNSSTTIPGSPSTVPEPTEPVASVHCKSPSSVDIAAANQFHQTGNFGSLREFTYALANGLCNQFGCEHIGIGIVRSGRIQLVAISGCAQFKASSPGVVDMRQAMEECLDQGEAVVFPACPGQTSLPVHRQWSVGSGGTQVCSLPLFDDGDAVGVISLRRSTTQPFTSDAVDALRQSVLPFGRLMSLVDRANQPLSRHMRVTVNEWLQARRSPLRIATVTVVTLLLTWFCFGTMRYRPLCDSFVVAAQSRNMTAPFESRLELTQVQAGDRVKAGDLLVEFDSQQLQLELETIRAEISRSGVNERAAIEQSDATSAALHRAHIRVMTTRQAALERRIESARLVAPSDGMVIRSSFDKRIGQVFAQGDPVLQFAPDEGWKLHVHVPEDAALYVHQNQLGTFAAAARPNDKVAFRITQVDGSASVVAQDNIFVASADLQEDPEWMRSGMRGIAQLNTIQKPVWWVASHKLIDWIRLRFWL